MVLEELINKLQKDNLTAEEKELFIHKIKNLNAENNLNNMLLQDEYTSEQKKEMMESIGQGIREMTVIRGDVGGSGTITSYLNSKNLPLSLFAKDWKHAMRETAHKYDGFVVKFGKGDEIFAVFGANPNHDHDNRNYALDGVVASIQMQMATAWQAQPFRERVMLALIKRDVMKFNNETKEYDRFKTLDELRDAINSKIEVKKEVDEIRREVYDKFKELKVKLSVYTENCVFTGNDLDGEAVKNACRIFEYVPNSKIYLSPSTYDKVKDRVNVDSQLIKVLVKETYEEVWNLLSYTRYNTPNLDGIIPKNSPIFNRMVDSDGKIYELQKQDDKRVAVRKNIIKYGKKIELEDIIVSDLSTLKTYDTFLREQVEKQKIRVTDIEKELNAKSFHMVLTLHELQKHNWFEADRSLIRTYLSLAIVYEQILELEQQQIKVVDLHNNKFNEFIELKEKIKDTPNDSMLNFRIKELKHDYISLSATAMKRIPHKIRTLKNAIPALMDAAYMWDYGRWIISGRTTESIDPLYETKPLSGPNREEILYTLANHGASELSKVHEFNIKNIHKFIACQTLRFDGRAKYSFSQLNHTSLDPNRDNEKLKHKDLIGLHIPIEVLINQVSDAVLQFGSDRPYRERSNNEEIVQRLKEGYGAIIELRATTAMLKILGSGWKDEHGKDGERRSYIYKNRSEELPFQKLEVFSDYEGCGKGIEHSCDLCYTYCHEDDEKGTKAVEMVGFDHQIINKHCKTYDVNTPQCNECRSGCPEGNIYTYEGKFKGEDYSDGIILLPKHLDNLIDEISIDQDDNKISKI